QHGATVKYNGLPVIQGHPEPLVLLFQNLLENGIKYSREGVPPEIEVTARRLESEWVISVRDNGQGFDAEYRDRIFRPFERLQGAGRSGSGIGLATCVKVAKLHDGRIWADSTPGHGSEFFIAFPS